jgi:hypothetical protein
VLSSQFDKRKKTPYLCDNAMKFYDKYPQLKEKGFLAQMLTNTVFSTMSLENQQVSMSKVEEIVMSLLEDVESKGSHFFSDQSR